METWLNCTFLILFWYLGAQVPTLSTSPNSELSPRMRCRHSTGSPSWGAKSVDWRNEKSVNFKTLQRERSSSISGLPQSLTLGSPPWTNGPHDRPRGISIKGAAMALVKNFSWYMIDDHMIYRICMPFVCIWYVHTDDLQYKLSHLFQTKWCELYIKVKKRPNCFCLLFDSWYFNSQMRPYG